MTRRQINDLCRTGAPAAACDPTAQTAELSRRVGVRPDRGPRAFGEHEPGGEPASVRCSACGSTIVTGGLLAGELSPALCLPCLRQRPDVTFAQRLFACRLAAGLTRGQLAARVGGSENTILRYESGRHRPGASRLAALAHVLGPDLLPAV
jgi:hypothetical protein